MNLTTSSSKQIKDYWILILPLFLTVLTLSGCATRKDTLLQETPTPSISNEVSIGLEGNEGIDNSSNNPNITSIITPPSYINEKGFTLETRINPPIGYDRINANPGELVSFLRTMAMKDQDSSVLLYDGSLKPNQYDHFSIFDLSTGDRDLQQCADSIIRIYAEYYWSQGLQDKIAFHLTSGFFMEYTKWRDGYRIAVDGNQVTWNKTKEYDDTYDTFLKYLEMVFAYAGTLSLKEESYPISLDAIMPGDMFLQGGSPGHCVLIVDIASDKDGNRSFLLAQGYMPAQDFHIIKNPLHEDDPWYYENELTFPLVTPSWTFKEDSLVRWADFPMSSNLLEAQTPSIPIMSNQGGKISQVTLLAVGDNLIHIEVVKSGEKSGGSYDFSHLYNNLTEEISSADISIINQETILGGNEFSYSGYPNFYSPVEIGEAVIEAGFDVVLHATNHTLDKGIKGLKQTFQFWNQHPEILVLGINQTKEQRTIIPLYEKNGIKIAMLNYTYGLNGYQLPEDQPYLVNMLNKTKMKEDILNAKEISDFVIVFPHWGAEYVYKPTSEQRSLVEFYYDLGVDLVIGAHPHVLEPVEWIQTNPDHKMLVYYSLGNFLSYQKEAPRMLGGIANITITKDDSGTYISDASITPIITHYEHGPLDYNYELYKLTDYSEELAQVHGVSDLAVQGPMSYDNMIKLASEVLGDWFTETEQ